MQQCERTYKTLHAKNHTRNKLEIPVKLVRIMLKSSIVMSKFNNAKTDH